jgi:hypothetical protein
MAHEHRRALRLTDVRFAEPRRTGRKHQPIAVFHRLAVSGVFPVDLIERAFHVSPDNGNGFTELTIVAVVAAISVLLIRSRRSNAAQPPLAERAPTPSP